jgi:hypothetical protein
MQGGDHLIRMLLFWGIFLPLGACFSVDAARSADHPAPRRVLSPGTVAYILQLCIVYWFAAAWKWAPEWRTEGTAVYLALEVDSFTTRFGLFLLQFPELLRYLTYSSLYLETLGPVLLFLPFAVGLQRMLAIAAFTMFHIGLALTLDLGNFPWVCMAGWVALLPSSFWDKVQAQLGPAGNGLTILYDQDRPRSRTATEGVRSVLFLWDAQLAPATEAGGQLARLTIRPRGAGTTHSRFSRPLPVCRSCPQGTGALACETDRWAGRAGPPAGHAPPWPGLGRTGWARRPGVRDLLPDLRGAFQRPQPRVRSRPGFSRPEPAAR